MSHNEFRSGILYGIWPEPLHFFESEVCFFSEGTVLIVGVESFTEYGGSPGLFLNWRTVILSEELVLNSKVETFTEYGGSPGLFLEVRPHICHEESCFDICSWNFLQEVGGPLAFFWK